MKKAFIIICTFLLALSLAACGGKTTQPSQTQAAASQNTPASSAKAGEDSSQQGNLLSTGYVNIMKSGKFLIRYKASITAAGETMESEVTTATDGKAVASIMKMQEISTHTIIKDNVLYMLDDKSKTYSKMEVSQEEKTEKAGSLVDTKGLNYVGKGTGTVNGKTLPYEEYRTGEETMRFYMDGKNLYAITSKTKDSEMQMVVLEFTDKIPNGMLSIPSGYKEGTVQAVPGGIDMSGE